MTVIGDAYIDVKGKTDDFDNDVSGKIGGIAKKAAAIFAGAFVVDKAIGFMKDSVGAASDLNETLNKSNTIFGENAKQIDTWSKTAATSLGLSRQKALEAAASFGDMFLQIGFSGEAAAKMSKATVQMSADIGSFNNLPTADVQQRISAAFRGEYDSLQAVIPNINAARVESEALAATGKKVAKELTAQEKATAVLAIVQKDGARAAGDFAKTSDGLANQQKILSARLEDVKAKIGTALLPIMTKLTTFVSNALTPALDFLTGIVRKAMDGWNSMDTVMTDGGKSMGKIFEIARALHGGIMALVSAFKEGDVTSNGFVGMMEKLGVILRKVYEDYWKPLYNFVVDNWQPIVIAAGIAIGLLLAPVLTIAGGLVFLYAKFEIVRDVVDAVAKALGAFIGFVAGAVGDFIDWWKGVWPQVGEAVKHAVNVVEAVLTVLQALWHSIGDDIWRYVQRTFDTIRNVIEAVMQVISGIIHTVLAVINGDWGKAWDGVKEIFGGVWKVITGMLDQAMNVIQLLLGGGLSVIGDLLAAAGGKIIDFFGGIPAGVLSAIGDVTSLLFNVGSAILEGLWSGLKFAFAHSFPVILYTYRDEIVGFFLLAGEWLLDAGKAVLGGLWEGIKFAFAHSFPMILVTYKDEILGFFTGAAKWLYDKGKDVLAGLWQGIQEVWDREVKFWSELPGKILGFLGDVGSTLTQKGRDLLFGLGNGIIEVGWGLMQWWQQLPGNILSWIGDTLSTLVGKGKDLLFGLGNGILEVANGTRQWFQSLGHNVGVWIGNTISTLVGKGRDLIFGLGNGIIEVSWGTMQWFAALPGRIVEWIGDAGSKLWHVGWNLLWGLGRGIIDFVPHLLQTIKDWVTDRIPWYVKKALGIDSPSKVFRGFGRNLIEGLALGLSDTRPVERAIGRLSDLSSPAMSFDFAASGARSVGSALGLSGAGGGVVVQLDLRGAMVTADSMAMLQDIVTDGVTEAMEAVERKVQAS